MGILIGIGSNKPKFPYDYYYGIEFDTAVSSPKCTRIGRQDLHVNLPIQSLMRRCLVDDQSGEVLHYLNANDSSKLDNGSVADLTGNSGQVMVELPEFFWKFEAEGTKRRVLMSIYAIPGFVKVPKRYVGAYEGAVDRTNNQLCSVKNDSEQFRGGNNNASYDGTGRSYLGRPATSISLTSFRTYARKNRSAAWNCNTYQIQKELYWLFAVEYANLNSQDAFNAQPTIEGFKQGGLGPGVTNLSSGSWSSFNGYNPFVPCGYTNSLGNNTGQVAFEMPSEYGSALTAYVNSYRGVESPFGHIWKWTDGILINIQSEADGGRSIAYVADDVNNYGSTIDPSKMKIAGDLPRGEGYMKEACFGANGEIIPMKTGGSATTYFCDYFYTNIPASGSSTRGLLFGGSAGYTTYAGFVYAHSHHTPSTTSASFGSRLCFMPES